MDKTMIYRTGGAILLLAAGVLAVVIVARSHLTDESAARDRPHGVVRQPPPEPGVREGPQYTPEERRFLLNLARKTVQEVVTSQRLSEIDGSGLSSNLTEPKGCFVTLNKKGQLRGCIGHIFPQEPLYKAVMDNARSAAVQDYRFDPVRPEELAEIEIEVSVLTVPQPLHFDSPDDLLEKLRPHVDGVVLQIGRRGATYLPQVWEQLPDKEEFLSRLSMKAGLPGSAWRSSTTKILTYQVEAFKESEM
jgi:AmmeMemoRadiSam system protein A